MSSIQHPRRSRISSSNPASAQAITDPGHLPRCPDCAKLVELARRDYRLTPERLQIWHEIIGGPDSEAIVAHEVWLDLVSDLESAELVNLDVFWRDCLRTFGLAPGDKGRMSRKRFAERYQGIKDDKRQHQSKRIV